MSVGSICTGFVGAIADTIAEADVIAQTPRVGGTVGATKVDSFSEHVVDTGHLARQLAGNREDRV